MIKRLMILLLLAAPLQAAGPRYHYSDPHLNDEISNIYQQIQAPQISTGTANKFTIGVASITSLTVVTSTITNLTVSGTAVGTFGKFVQWVSTTNATGFGTTSTTFVQTNLRGQITGVSASNRVLVCVTGDLGHSAADQCTYMTIERNATNLLGGTTALVRTCSPQTAVLGSDAFTACYVDATPTAGINNYSVYIKVSGANSGSFDAVDTNFMLMAELKP